MKKKILVMFLAAALAGSLSAETVWASAAVMPEESAETTGAEAPEDEMESDLQIQTYTVPSVPASGDSIPSDAEETPEAEVPIPGGYTDYTGPSLQYSSLKHNSVDGVATTEVRKAAIQVIIGNEGNYASVNGNDNGAISVGELQWHGNRALTLVQAIIGKNNESAYQILGSEYYEEIIASKSWNSYILDAKHDENYQVKMDALKTLLATPEGKELQDAQAKSDVTDYINHGMAWGLQNAAALVYYADLENQYGQGSMERMSGAGQFMAAATYLAGGSAKVTLNELHLGVICRTDSYKSRRQATYTYAATRGWTFCHADDHMIPDYYRYHTPTTDQANWIQTTLNLYQNAGLPVDGSFGPKTKEQISLFQESMGLKADGYAGPDTLAALIRTMYKKCATSAVIGVTISTGETIDYPYGKIIVLKDAVLSAAQISYAVNDTQESFALEVSSNHIESALSYSSSQNQVAEVDASGLVTIKGAGKTELTVTQPKSQNYKEAAPLKITLTVYATNPASYKAPLTSLGEKFKMTAAGIQWLQASLMRLGYYDGLCNGTWSTELTEIVKKFQRDAALEADGIVGSASRTEIQNLVTVKRAATKCKVKGGSGKITVSWSKTRKGTGYYVYRKEKGGSYKKIATIKKPSTTSYVDKKAEAGKTYYYCVKVYRKTGTITAASVGKTSAAVKRTR